MPIFHKGGSIDCMDGNPPERSAISLWFLAVKNEILVLFNISTLINELIKWNNNNNVTECIVCVQGHEPLTLRYNRSGLSRNGEEKTSFTLGRSAESFVLLFVVSLLSDQLA